MTIMLGKTTAWNLVLKHEFSLKLHAIVFFNRTMRIRKSNTKVNVLRDSHKLLVTPNREFERQYQV
jgi:hypothetical protein